MAKKGFSIGRVAHRTGLAVSAIRFYEEKGLVTPDRTPSGQRQFTAGDIRRLSFVLIAQELGFTIREIREILSTLPEARTPTRSDWSRLSRGFQKTLDHRIQLMQRLRDQLDGCIGCGCLSLKRCALYNPDDRAARSGPGPQYLLNGPPNQV
ncbi:MAG: redox-sensitive transcriptional activator SoxR [Pseudomonadota bacterium]